jgi:hypothetical protein
MEQTALAQSLDPTHASPASQRGHAPEPPQSTSVSSPFSTRSPHVGARHWFSWHDALPQSDPESQRLPAKQGGHTPPPQSTSASPPLRTSSLHPGEAQTLLGREQKLLSQSRSSRQDSVSSHAGHVGPPQSTSLSREFFTSSVHDGGWHVPSQTVVKQSLALEHGAPTPHFGQVGPPQSTPVSLPFRTVSLHAGARHLPL